MFSTEGIEPRNILLSLPILFTSFGVQNVCPHVYNFLDKDAEKTKKAFLLGISITAVVYIGWIYMILCSIKGGNPAFYAQILSGNANSGDLINSICKISGSEITHILLKGVSLLAIITSAVGIAVGIGVSLEEIFKKHVMIMVAAIPTAVTLLVPNAFINVLSFGGMMATVFVVFMPVYLHFLIQKEKKYDPGNIICAAFAIAVVIGEFLSKG
jgi:amino acid permease